MSFKFVSALAVSAVLMCANVGARAESEFTVFGGLQGAPHSRVNISGSLNQSFLSAWEGRSFSMPAYYGLRFTQWWDQNWGTALSFVHTKVYSSDQTRSEFGFQKMELTDGINPLTLDVTYRSSQKFAGFVPYAAIGVGISVPHVELQKGPSDPLTFEYQYGGPVLTARTGVKYPITDNWSVMMEYQFHYYMINVGMAVAAAPDATFETKLITNALNVGISYNW